MPVTHEDMLQFVELWKQYDPEATGFLRMYEPDATVDTDGSEGPVVNKLEKFLAELPLSLGYNELGKFFFRDHSTICTVGRLFKVPCKPKTNTIIAADEEPILLRELRLIEMPDGSFSRFLVEAEDEDDPASTIQFHELLYGLLERKCGRPLPEDNRLVEETRRTAGLLMPSIEAQVKAVRKVKAASAAEDATSLDEQVSQYNRLAGLVEEQSLLLEGELHVPVGRSTAALVGGAADGARGEDEEWHPKFCQLGLDELRWGHLVGTAELVVERAVSVASITDVSTGTRGEDVKQFAPSTDVTSWLAEMGASDARDKLTESGAETLQDVLYLATHKEDLENLGLSETMVGKLWPFIEKTLAAESEASTPSEGGGAAAAGAPPGLVFAVTCTEPDFVVHRFSATSEAAREQWVEHLRRVHQAPV